MLTSQDLEDLDGLSLLAWILKLRNLGPDDGTPCWLGTNEGAKTRARQTALDFLNRRPGRNFTRETANEYIEKKLHMQDELAEWRHFEEVQRTKRENGDLSGFFVRRPRWPNEK